MTPRHAHTQTHTHRAEASREEVTLHTPFSFVSNPSSSVYFPDPPSETLQTADRGCSAPLELLNMVTVVYAGAEASTQNPPPLARLP